MEYKRLTKKIVDDGTVQISYADRIVGCYHRDEMIRERLAELEDKIESGTLKEIPEGAVVLTKAEYESKSLLAKECLKWRWKYGNMNAITEENKE